VNLRADAPDAAERIGLIIASRVPVASFAQAPKPELIATLKDAGVITIASVGARRHAEKVAAWGIDAVIATGGEGGGHIGAVPTSLLMPQVAAAVDIPVIAAGGFFDGRGLVAALAYGAAGIAMGTRFLLTSDSPVADAVKQVYLAAGLTGTVVTTRVDGVPHRVLRTTMVDHLERAGKLTGLLRAAGNAAAFRGLSGLSWREMLRQGRAMRRDTELTWGQVLMARTEQCSSRPSPAPPSASGSPAASTPAGVIERALELTAEYARSRVQVGRPIGSFQAVTQRLADAYIDAEEVRLTMWQAAWLLAEGDDAAGTAVATAKFWAADAGHRVAHTAVHVHGGLGIDMSYPVHRYFVAAKHHEFTLGGATAQLRRIGVDLRNLALPVDEQVIQ